MNLISRAGVLVLCCVMGVGPIWAKPRTAAVPATAQPLSGPGEQRRIDPDGERLDEAIWLRLRGLAPGQRPRVAVVLSGGGARGLSHIGVLKVLEREKVPVDLVVGTSVGALVGALYAAGIPLTDIERMSREVGWDTLTDVSTSGLVRLLVSETLLSSKKTEEYLIRQLGEKTFDQLKIPFACTAVDIRTGELLILREGSVALAARASATMPGVFEPVSFRHRLLVDGGVVNNVPTDVARLLGADVIICSYAPADFSRRSVSNVLMTLNQALYIQGQVLNETRLAAADLVIRPQVRDVATFELWKSAQCVAAGEQAAQSAWTAVRTTLAHRFFERWMRAGKS